MKDCSGSSRRSARRFGSRFDRPSAYIPGLFACALALVAPPTRAVVGAGPQDAAPPAEQAAAPPIGDPGAGEQHLLHGGYIGAGIPIKLWKLLNPPLPREARALDRPGVDPSVPDDINQYRTSGGAEVVSGLNCLGCHAQMFRGKLVIGMGNSLRDWPSKRTSYAPLRALGVAAYAKDSPEWRTLSEFLRGAEALEGRAPVPVRGLNPAFRFEELAAAHRHPADLSWSEQPLFEVPPEGAWSDVPPWWNVRKKSTLYYNGMGRGDFARLIQQISVVMIGGAADAEQALPHMHDLLAYVRTLRPPKHPGPIDPALREVGERIFGERCAECHGTYGEHETYPNKLVPLDKIGTDPVYAQRLRSSGIHTWFNKSWYAGDGAAYADPALAYVAPPLDGIWCTAPYFHNGSVPTLEGVLDTSRRPARWRRSFRDDDYDADAPGWRFEVVAPDPEAPASREVYDVSIPGCGNGGHDFGDDLTGEQRRALLEYLKTL